MATNEWKVTCNRIVPVDEARLTAAIATIAPPLFLANRGTSWENRRYVGGTIDVMRVANIAGPTPDDRMVILSRERIGAGGAPAHMTDGQPTHAMWNASTRNWTDRIVDAVREVAREDHTLIAAVQVDRWCRSDAKPLLSELMHLSPGTHFVSPTELDFDYNTTDGIRIWGEAHANSVGPLSHVEIDVRSSHRYTHDLSREEVAAVNDTVQEWYQEHLNEVCATLEAAAPLSGLTERFIS